MSDTTPTLVPATKTEHLDAWDKRPGEPNRAYAVFCVYRDMGARRSLQQTAKRFYGADYGPAKFRQCMEWSRNWGWVERAASWDAHLDREGRIAHVEAVREMNKTYANAARAALGKAIKGLQEIKPAEMEPADVARLIELAHKIERICMGEATEHIKQAVDVRSESKITLEVVEEIVPIRGTVIVTTTPALPAPASQTPPLESLATDAEIVEDNEDGEAPSFDLPEEPPLQATVP